jgi:hypothetical protein
MWTTPPSTEVDVQLVTGTAEMEAIMASSPEIPSTSMPQHRYDRKDKLASHLSNISGLSQEAVICNQIELTCTNTDDMQDNTNNTSPIKATTPNTLNSVTDRHQSSSTTTTTITTHKRHLHHHRRHSGTTTNQLVTSEKSLRRLGHGGTSSNTKRKPFYIRYW